MRKRLVAASAAVVLGPLSASIWASVSAEQIEAYETPSTTAYAAIDFNSQSLATQTSGNYVGITFHAADSSKVTLTLSSHAMVVGNNMYGLGGVGHNYVSDVYALPYDSFFDNVINSPGTNIGSAPAPGNFSTGVQVVNASFVADYGVGGADLDALRRLDFMINRNDVTFVAGAVGGSVSSGTLPWSSFNALAVTGHQTFTPTGGPGKQHADLFVSDQASFGTALVSGFAIGLYGNAQTVGLSDAQHSYVMRSLLMTGAYKGGLPHLPSNSPTGALDPYYGAGNPDYDKSLQILQSGEKALATVVLNTAIGTSYSTQQGWTTATVTSGHQSVLLFNSSNAITGLTASLNWNVTTSGNATTINTSNASSNFPALSVEVKPVTLISGIYQIGASLGNYTFVGNVANDNVQYLWANTGLPAGNYAFVITGDSTKNATVGFSYVLAGSFASRWNSNTSSSWGTLGNWTSGIPNGQGAQANFLALPGLNSAGNITLDSNRTVGQITFNNSNGYTITPGSAGSLFIDDTGDSTGVIAPSITVLVGSHNIAVPVKLINGVTTTIAAGTALNITGVITGTGGLSKSGLGTLTLSNADSYGATTINAGNLIYAASTTGIVNNSQSLTINAAATTTLAASALPGNRQLLIAPTLNIAGNLNAWTGKLDLNNNDLDATGASLGTIINQLKQGFNNGGWNGNGGIISTLAGSNSSQLTALGVMQNNQSGAALYTADQPFDGNTAIGAADIVVKYTYYGDADLNGKVDASDYSRIDNGYLLHGTSWFDGDFNYDGVVNGSDYTLIDNAFNRQGGVISAVVANPLAMSTAVIAGSSSVPEPAALGIISIAALGALRRRKAH